MAHNPPTVLFVEDCDSDFELACVSLQQVSPRVNAQRVSCGRDLEKYIESQVAQVSLYIVDLSLPDTSGFVLAKQLRQTPESAETPIVIFSSSTNPRDAENAKRCGADDYHIKPIVPDDFLRVVETIISRWLPQN